MKRISLASLTLLATLLAAGTASAATQTVYATYASGEGSSVGDYLARAEVDLTAACSGLGGMLTGQRTFNFITENGTVYLQFKQECDVP